MNSKTDKKKKQTQQWDAAIDAVTKSAYRTIITVLDRLAIFASAAVPAMSLGVSLAMTLVAAAGWHILPAGFVGFSAAFGLEGYGLKSLRARFSNPDSRELKKKSHVYLQVGISLLWIDAAVLVANGLLSPTPIFDVGGIAIAAAGTGFAILSYHYYGINGIETAIKEKRQAVAIEKETAVSKQHETDVKEEAEAARLIARLEGIDDEERQFKMEQRKLNADVNRNIRENSSASDNHSASSKSSDSVPRQSSSALTPEMIVRITEIYEAFAEGQIITTAEAALVAKKSPRTMQKVMMAGVVHGVFTTPKRGRYLKNGVNPSTLV